MAKRIRLNTNRLRSFDFGGLIPARPSVPVESLIKCRFCGRSFGTKYVRDQHEDEHIRAAKKDGLVPRYIYDPRTNDVTIEGWKSIADE